MPTTRASVIAGATDEYRAALAAIEKAVKRHFPRATRVFFQGMPGLVVKRSKGAPRFERAGTMDPDVIFFGLAPRKNGMTLNIWYPAPGAGLSAHTAALTRAGLKVMVGCIASNRKGPFPVLAIEPVLVGIAANERRRSPAST